MYLNSCCPENIIYKCTIQNLYLKLILPHPLCRRWINFTLARLHFEHISLFITAFVKLFLDFGTVWQDLRNGLLTPIPEISIVQGGEAATVNSCQKVTLRRGPLYNRLTLVLSFWLYKQLQPIFPPFVPSKNSKKNLISLAKCVEAGPAVPTQ